MIKSMTGFGRTEVEIGDKKVFIDIKSLNSKQLDVNLKLPWLYKEKEAEIRTLVGKYLCRGKIDVTIYFDSTNGNNDMAYRINQNVVADYYNQLKNISQSLNLTPIESEDILRIIMKLPEVTKSEQREFSDEEWQIVKNGFIEALKSTDLYRIEEGKAIDADFRRAVTTILDYLDKVAEFDGGRIERIRKKLENGFLELIPQEKIDKNRLEQELIFYIEKLDINEEKVRLRKHCEYFFEKMEEKQPNGKILNFISQEMGREINTLGSKANDVDIQKLVVNMKDELEKIKEQTLNVL